MSGAKIFTGYAKIEGLKTGDDRIVQVKCSVCKKPIADDETVSGIIGASEIWHHACNEERKKRHLLVIYGPPNPATRARDPICVNAWPECFSGGYDPRCCRFPKSCSC